MADSKQRFADSVVVAIESGKVASYSDLNELKLRLAHELHLPGTLSNPTILSFVDNPSVAVKRLLGIKPVRTISGVAPVAIMTKPIDCRHGTCIFCPGGEESVFGSIPKSYTGHEPASMRAISNHFDSYLQTFNRLYQLAATGHNFQKVELILMGGTFPSFVKEYRHEFVSGMFKALNDFSDCFFSGSTFDSEKFNSYFSLHGFDYKKNSQEFLDFLLKQKGEPALKKEQDKNETSNVRLVAFCIETKPDWCMRPEIDDMLNLGATRVELGIQSLQDEVLAFSNRGHSVADSIESTRLLKDSALKVTYHMMPGLPKSTPEIDIDNFRELFENPDFCPDALKIYPCMVMPGTPLFKLYEQGKFEPLSSVTAAEIIARGKRFFPKWVRVQRVMRDIPTKWSTGEIAHNNLRQMVEQKCQELGISCQCIRCREAGQIQLKQKIKLNPQTAKINVEKYEASLGTEFFISADDEKSNALFGFCRLRIPHKPFRPEISNNSGLIRELHVFGEAIALGEQKTGGLQHAGLGKKLLQKAEDLAAEFGKKESIVISGIGAREYYRKLGYENTGPFMKKTLV